MADVAARRVRQDVDDLYCWTLAEGDVAIPKIVDFRQLTVVVPQGVKLEGAMNPDPAGQWFTLRARELPLSALLPDQHATLPDRVYQVRPVGVGETWLHLGGK